MSNGYAYGQEGGAQAQRDQARCRDRGDPEASDGGADPQRVQQALARGAIVVDSVETVEDVRDPAHDSRELPRRDRGDGRDPERLLAVEDVVDGVVDELERGP